jgi:PAS domain-containing protein
MMQNLETDLLQNHNTAINELSMHLVAEVAGNDIQKMFDLMMKTKLEKYSRGFWIWDTQNNVELYSPKFRESLGFEGEEDFPSVPESWMNQIYEESLKLALGTFALTEKTKGKVKYIQRVKYYKKDGSSLEVLCHGVVTKWTEDNKVAVMVGVHMNEDYLFEPS